MSGELVGLIIGFVLTIFIFSYAFGDNALYRLAVHILVGVSAAYAAIIVTRHVIVPNIQRVSENPTNPENLLWLVPIALLLLLYLLRRWTGNGAVAFLMGVGAAVALVGAVRGTIVPLVTAVPDQILFPGQSIVTALLTISTLMTFQFTRRINTEEPRWQTIFSQIGRAVIMITFGALFAGALNTSLLLLADRLDYLIQIPGQVIDLIR
jgi:hypothetical protein